ncbi:MAG TPA: SDR family NAD(P)-dependent oxidoreductase [Pyrinomonadaceae bacterium]|nr:SDR family NAD(P)-dependent oxidoreductase [Pyrinomonadaceae bacterium]
MLNALRNRPHFLILSADAPADEQLEVSASLALEHRRILLEVVDAEGLPAAPPPHVEGLIACGTEAGGWVSESATFILLRKLLERGTLPVYVRGISGVYGMAASRVGGACGAVLDSQLLLMPESPVPASWRTTLAALQQYDTTLLGAHSGRACRVVRHGSFPALARAEAAARELEAAGDKPREDLHDALARHIGWDDPDRSVWPVGQSIGAASQLAERYNSVGSLLSRWPAEMEEAIRQAADYPFAAATPLAASHGTLYPVVQGAMTRVSDNPRFARAVAEAGGLPLLALALLRGREVADLLARTAGELKGSPWGVGLLGFVPQEIRDEQISEVLKVRPPYALIAGGRPDQALEMEASGIATYLHVPVPRLLQDFLSQGARRFVFEGRESGGHVGPLGSCVLWEGMAASLLRHVPEGEEERVHVLFSGGIYDARSAAMAGVFAAPLARRGMKVGVLMGTPYLFTREAVETGAIIESFQREALECRATTTLESGPGHANRCAVTDFAREFGDRRRRLLRESATADELKAELERLSLGRLRLATRGKTRDAEGRLVEVAREVQKREGMYMLGEAATLRSSVLSMAELHADICESGAGVVREALPAAPAVSAPAATCDVAIVGVSVLLPGAADVETFWANVLGNRSAVTEIPPERWDWRLLYDPDKKARDRSYSKWGGFFSDIVFDPVRFGIPPDSVKDIGVPQLLALELIRRALVDAGYESREFDRERTAVILAEAEHGGVLHQQHVARTLLPFLTPQAPQAMLDRLAEWTADSFPGSLSNITAGRVANRFDFGGSNFVIDAACASSLVALDLAIQELALRRSDVVITGGIDTGQHPYGYVAFSKTQALSETGRSRPFDKRADGIVISEGVAVAVLKRLEDAERDGDRIYAVLRGVGGSSDGKAMGMTAPRPAGQVRALRRCYQRAAIPFTSVGYYEAHGTGTPVGDAAELETVSGFLRSEGAGTRQCAISSVKGLIGHTKTAAGIVGIVKAAMALRHRVLPGHPIDEPLDDLQAPDSPLFLLREPRPWFAAPGSQPRRAAVSAFGFGGTNSHAVLEEYGGGYETPAPGAERWPAELVLFRGASRAALTKSIETLLHSLPQGTAVPLREVARLCAQAVTPGGGHSLAVVAGDVDELRQQLAAFIDDADAPTETASRFFAETPAEAPPVAFLFPGQGAQYPNMAREAALFFEEFREGIEGACQALAPFYPQSLAEMIYPPAEFDAGQRERNVEVLKDSHVAQPAIGVISTCYARLARRVGINPAMMGGHSYGEFSALHAAGAISWQDFLRISELRGRVMGAARGGAMAAVKAPAEEVEKRLAEFEGVVAASYNAPDEVAVSGPVGEVERLVASLDAAGVRCSRLKVSGAFHSPMMEAAQTPFAEALGAYGFAAPAVPVYSNADAQRFPGEESDIRRRLQQHMSGPVRFTQLVEEMYASGARVFIDMGPGGVLRHLVGRILGDRPYLVLGLDGGLRETLAALGRLWTAGVVREPGALFDGRCDPNFRPEELAQRAKVSEPPATAYYVNGFSARRLQEPRRAFNKLPLLDSEARGREAAAPPSPTSAPAAPPHAVPEQHTPGSPSAAGGDAILSVYESYQQTMRQFLKTQEEVLRNVLGATAAPGAYEEVLARPHDTIPLAKIEEPTAEPLVVEAAPAHPEAAPPQPEPEPEQNDLQGIVLGTVSELTGYPVSMLGMEADLEAELGIDSIRRLEIINRLQQKLPAEVGRAASQNTERLARSRTLSALLEALSASPLSPPTAPAVLTRGATEPESAACPRYVIRERREDLRERDEGRRIDGTFIIIGERSPDLPYVVRELQRRGAGARVLTSAECRSASQIEECVRQVQKDEYVAGVINLTAAAEGGIPSGLERWRELTQTHCKRLFMVLRACSVRQTPLRWVVSVSNLGGLFGREGLSGKGLPSEGAPVGLLNSYKLEYPETLVKSIDLDPNRPPSERAAHVINEMLFGGRDVEAGYPGGARHLFGVVESPLADEPLKDRPASDWVFLVTGGARGITARIVQAMALPGQKMVIVGRSSTVAKDPELVKLVGREQIREYLIQRSAAGRPESPVSIERQVGEVLRHHEIASNIDLLRRLGVDVHYRSVDVRSSTEFVEVIQKTYQRFGRIDAVIHGAGIIADKLLVDKEVDSFDAVFDTKADSAFLLFQHLRPEELKLMMFLSSTAARFGNRGQMDYAAANEVLNRFAWTMDKEWDATRVASINWGPWMDTGMASPLLDKFRASGIVPIDPHEGSRFAAREAAHASCDIEVIAGEGPWRGSAAAPPGKGLSL